MGTIVPITKELDQRLKQYYLGPLLAISTCASEPMPLSAGGVDRDNDDGIAASTKNNHRHDTGGLIGCVGPVSDWWGQCVCVCVCAVVIAVVIIVIVIEFAFAFAFVFVSVLVLALVLV